MPQKMMEPADIELPIEVKYFAKNLRAARISAGLTQRDLSKLTGITQGVLSEYERGLRALGIIGMAKIATAVNIPLWQLLRPN